MLAFGRRKLAGVRRASLLRGDLRTFVRPRSFDFAYCLGGSIRHLMNDRDVFRHLRAVRRSLRPGGVYVVGFDLCDYRRPEPDEEAWTIRDGRRTLRHVQLCLPADGAFRRETILQFVSAGRAVERFEYALRTYDARQWRDVIRRSGFRVSAVYDLWGRRARLDGRLRAATFVLAPR